jgi:oligopeptide/dipeptide ABC transporter ATP-binding protein
MTPLVEAAGLTKHFPIRAGGLLHRHTIPLRAVDDVALRIEPGETLGLVGESGCGKSTLGRLLIRLLAPTAGNVIFDGDDITRLRPAELREKRRSMQIIFQDPYGALNPRMSVEDIIMEPLLIHGARAGAETRRTVGAMLERVGLPARVRDRFPHEFSGGQRQRIGIARALVLRPRFVVCDEPVSALDVSVQAQIVNLLQDLQGELGLTYLFIAHDLGVVKHISTRVAVMYLGKIVEFADKHTLYANPLHPYTQALIAAVPAAHPARRSRGRRERLTDDVPSALHPPSGCRFHTRCPWATEVCREEEPPLAEYPGGHVAACHHPRNVSPAEISAAARSPLSPLSAGRLMPGGQQAPASGAEKSRESQVTVRTGDAPDAPAGEG